MPRIKSTLTSKEYFMTTHNQLEKEIGLEQAGIFAKMEALVQLVDAEKRDFTLQEQGQWNALEAEYKGLGKKLERHTSLAAMDRELDQPVGRSVQGFHTSESDDDSNTSGRKKSYRSLFGIDSLDKDGFRSLHEFIGAVHSGRFDPRLKETRAGMSEGVGSEGGFLVPTEFAAEIIDSALENEIVRPRARVFPMISDKKIVPGFDGSDHTSNLYGGFSGQWLAENSVAGDQAAKFRSISLLAKKLACFTKCSNELLADASNFENVIGDALVRAVGWFLDYAFLRGSGAGQPLGVLNSPSLIVVAKEGGQTADTINSTNLLKMYARMHPAHLNNAIWIANPSTLPQLLSLTLGSNSAFTPMLVRDGSRYYLLGNELLLSEKVPTLGDQGDLVFVDLSQYGVGLRKEISLDRSQHVGWHSDQSHYRVLLRADGQSLLNVALTPKHGVALSWVVALEAR